MIYFETSKAIKGLDFEAKGRLFDAIMEYAEYGVIPDFDCVLAAIWPFIAINIDRDSARYEEIRQMRIKAGRKGGQARARKQKQSEAKEADAMFVKQIKPSSSPSPTPTPASAPASSSSTEKGIRDNEERAKGLTSASQSACSEGEDLEFEEKRMDAIRMLEGWGGVRDGL